MDRFAGFATVIALVLMVTAGPHAATAQLSPASSGCWVRGERSDLELRASPYDSAAVSVPSGTVKVCYSRPRKLERPIMGRLVPYGEPWRLGANEATAIHMPADGSIAGVTVGPGWYSLYAIPDEHEWRIVVNEAVRRWGIPIDDEVRARDIGSGTAPVATTDETVEMMSLDLERRSGGMLDLVIEWDRTRVVVPVTVSGAGSG